MTLDNKLHITDPLLLARTEERISKQKAPKAISALLRRFIWRLQWRRLNACRRGLSMKSWQNMWR